MFQSLVELIADVRGDSDWTLAARDARPPLVHYVVLALGVISALLMVAVVVYVLTAA